MVRIEPRGDEQQAGRHRAQKRQYDFFPQILVAAVADAGRQRDVDGRSLPRPVTGLLACARSRIPVLLMQRAEDDAWVVIEGFLRAVAVVDIPVENEHALDAA